MSERLTNAYANATTDVKARKRLEGRARHHREDPDFERLRQLPESEREAILNRSGQRLAYGFYISGREAATELEKQS